MVIIKNAIENIKTNKLRVIVAMVWIVLGITSVVVVSSIGNGIEQQGKEASKNVEFRTINITYYPNYESNLDASFFEPFSEKELGKVNSVKGIERVTPKYGDSGRGSHSVSLNVRGRSMYTKTTEYKKDKKIDIIYGRNFSMEDLDRKTIVLDYNIAYELGDSVPQNAIGKSVNIEGEDFEVIGVLKNLYEEGKMVNSHIEPESYLPKKALKDLENKKSFGGAITSLEVIVNYDYDINDVGTEIVEILQSGISKENGEYANAGNDSGSHELGIMQQTINRFTSILSKVSLFIGGIGIMNIMYMSVAERKREIGIRRAIGAEPKDILIQFLIETIVITILGGIVGIIVGTIAANQVGPYLGVPAIPSLAVYTKAVVVSILTGAIFGAIPALKAAKLDTIKAIQG